MTHYLKIAPPPPPQAKCTIESLRGFFSQFLNHGLKINTNISTNSTIRSRFKVELRIFIYFGTLGANGLMN